MVQREAMSEFTQKLQATWPPELWADVNVVFAVSGGADSVALLRAGLEIRPAESAGRITVAHFNHRWRGADSNRDQQFVADLSARLGIPCATRWADISVSERTETAARESRYAFLRQLAHETGARFIATAHTADDQAETILHRVVRGTGVAGLAGIPRTRTIEPHVTLVRPMLNLRRSDLLEYLAAIGQSYCEDSTNADPRFTRSRIRHDLLPQLASDYNPRVVDALLRLGRLASDNQLLADRLAAETAHRCCLSRTDSEIVIDCARLDQEPEPLRRAVLVWLWKQADWPLQAMNLDKWDQLATLVDRRRAEPLNLPGNRRARRVESRLVIERGD
jgi:tRNA(Ile)-lysidine synthase